MNGDALVSVKYTSISFLSFALLYIYISKYIAAPHYIHQLSLSLSLFCAADIRRQTGTPSKKNSSTFFFLILLHQAKDNNKNKLSTSTNLKSQPRSRAYTYFFFRKSFCNSYINLYSTPLYFFFKGNWLFFSFKRALFLLLSPTATTI